MRFGVLLFTFAGMMLGATIDERTYFSATNTSGTCSIVNNGVPVYTGDDTDRLCRNYRPEVGVGEGDITNFAYADLAWAEVEDEGERIFTGTLGYEFYYYMYGMLRSHTTEDGSRLQTRVEVSFNESFEVRATLPGTGYGRFLAFSESPPSVGLLRVPAISVEFPSFQLGLESVVAIINVSLPPTYLDEDWWGAYNGGGFQLGWSPEAAPLEATGFQRAGRFTAETETPEPGTAFLVAGSLAGVLTRRLIRS
jgi:hypothetical protein